MSIEAVAWAFKQDVTPAAKKFVLVAICDNADQHGFCFPSYTHIQQKTSLSRRAVIDNINSLVFEGFLDKAPRIRATGSQSTNAYLIPALANAMDDHPLRSLFEKGGAGDAPHPVQEMHPPGAGDAPHINHQYNPKEKKGAATRTDFLREIDKGLQDGEFNTFDHLSESEIKFAAEACLDFWGAKGEWPAGDPVAVVRHWIRGGMKKGKIRKRDQYPPMEVDDRPQMSAEESQWRNRLKGFLDRGFWHPAFGPSPDETGCKAPLHLMNEFFPDGKVPANA